VGVRDRVRVRVDADPSKKQTKPPEHWKRG